jgi:hypothetical protein
MSSADFAQDQRRKTAVSARNNAEIPWSVASSSPSSRSPGQSMCEILSWLPNKSKRRQHFTKRLPVSATRRRTTL